MSQLMNNWYLSHRQPAKAQASLRIRAISPEALLFAHIKYGRRIGHLALLDGCACAFEEWVYGGRKVPKSHDMAHMDCVKENDQLINPAHDVFHCLIQLLTNISSTSSISYLVPGLGPCRDPDLDPCLEADLDPTFDLDLALWLGLRSGIGGVFEGSLWTVSLWKKIN